MPAQELDVDELVLDPWVCPFALDVRELKVGSGVVVFVLLPALVTLHAGVSIALATG